MHERFAKRIEERLESLGRRLERSRRRLDREAIGRQIGRILEQEHAAPRGATQIRVEDDATSPRACAWSGRRSPSGTTGRGTARAPTSCAPTCTTGARRSCGGPTSSSPRPRRPSASTRATSRSGPIWHQKAERVQAHILVCFLAYVLWKTLEQWQQRAGSATARARSSRSSAASRAPTWCCPLADSPGRELRIRCVVRPDKAQAMLLDRLGLRLPERLRVPPHVAEM